MSWIEIQKNLITTGAWELYKSDHQLVFDFIEKTDENFYGAFKGNDEEYIGFITDYVKPYIEQSREPLLIFTQTLLDESFTAQGRASIPKLCWSVWGRCISEAWICIIAL